VELRSFFEVVNLSGLKISVMLSNLKMDEYKGMKEVVKMGVPGIHLSVGSGRFAPDNMDQKARKTLVEHVRSLGLEISAVSAWGGDVDLCEAEKGEENVAWAKKIIDLAVDLETSIWQGHIGIMPKKATDPRWKTLLENTTRIASYAESRGACLAIETGPEPPPIVRRLIETVKSPGLRVNYDPANLILWPAILAIDADVPYDKEESLKEFMPVEGVKVLGPYVVHTHAKDAIVSENGQPKEVPLGEGWIDWPRYVKLLREYGFDGYFAIERETGKDPVGDIKKAVAFLRSLS